MFLGQKNFFGQKFQCKNAIKSVFQIISNAEFGYNCHYGHCYLIPSKDSNDQGLPPGILLDITSFTVPFIIFSVSYGYLWFYMWNSHRYLKKHGTRLVFL